MGTTGNSGRGRAAAAAPAPKPKVSAKVYRRRRLVAFILVLLVIGGLVAGGFFIAGLIGNGTDTGPGGEAAGSGSTAKPKPGAKPGTPPSGVCDEAGIKVTAATDKQSYGPEESPVLTLRVTNTGKAPCDINVGTSQMEYQVTSGDDVIFNSRDCQLESTDLVKNLKPGASETANFVWKVKRSAPECSKVAAAPGRGGATYALVATMGKWSSDKALFTLN